MIILGIETSCDETAAAVLKKENNRVTILSNVVASSAKLQAKYGGVIPEQAAREQIKSIIPVIKEALTQAGLTSHPEFISGSNRFRNKFGMTKRVLPDTPGIDAIAVTYGPGLIGSLLVGVETAKVLAAVWNKPLIPVNHLLGHFYANWITQTPTFPCLGLLVSGGHTDLILFKDHGKYEYLGGTRDDAAGECFDKCARLLNLPYPGGPAIAKLSQKGNPDAFTLPRPMIDSKDLDFSFSGLKTAVSNLLKEAKFESVKAIGEVSNLIKTRGDGEKGIPAHDRSERQRVRTYDGTSSRQDPEFITNLATSIEQAIVDVLVVKTIKAAQTYNIDQIIVAGGVAANQKLHESLSRATFKINPSIKLFIPPPVLCTDNAAMIASAAFFNYLPVNPIDLQANPNLSLSF